MIHPCFDLFQTRCDRLDCSRHDPQHLFDFLLADNQRRDHAKYRVDARGQGQQAPIETGTLHQRIEVGRQLDVRSARVRRRECRVGVFKLDRDEELESAMPSGCTHAESSDLLNDPSTILHICLNLVQSVEHLFRSCGYVSDHVVRAHVTGSCDTRSAGDRIARVRATLKFSFVRPCTHQ